MKQSKIIFSLLLLLIPFCSIFSQTQLRNKNNTIVAQINGKGVLDSLEITSINPKAKAIAFRNDDFQGPSLVLNGEALNLKRGKSATTYAGETTSLKYELSYIIDNDKLGVEITCTNTTNAEIEDIQLSLQLGVNTEMRTFPEWRDKFFPTLMRCEKTHFWGYLMSPDGRVLTVSSPDPIASYRLHYNNSKNIFAHGHLIRTVSLDLINPQPLPTRHPEGSSSLLPSQTRKWTVYFQEVENLDKVKSAVAQNTKAPMIASDLYSIGMGQKSTITITSSTNPELTVKTPDNKLQKLKLKKTSKTTYTASLEPNSGKGVYTVYAKDSKTKRTTEAKISYIENSYSDYIKSARRTAIKYPQQPSSHTESWYGFFPGYIAKELFPDEKWDKQLDEKFDEIYPLLYDTDLDIPTYFMHRIQNHALMAALFAQKYKASGDIEDLRRAANLSDYIMAQQSPDGAYRNGKTHYTSVIYIAKALMEVMEEEAKLKDTSEEWANNYRRHYHSVKKAVDELTANLDNIETEGEMTFEDGMISCSYTQIAQFALLQPEGSAERKKYVDAAEKMVELHRCLSQLIIPDSRMNGGSMRYWEAQYDILTSPNMMNSPHGWSAWRIYGLKYLYELTGKYEYLEQMMNAIGSCIQLLDPDTDELNWAFIIDPYINADVFVEDPANKGKGIYEKQVIGEQYMPMISDWNRPEPNTRITGYWGYDGGKCDNDVHEIFKCLGEILLTSAYVHEMSDGTYKAFNCSVKKVNASTIEVTPNENCIGKVHMKVTNPITVKMDGAKDNKVNKSGWIAISHKM